MKKRIICTVLACTLLFTSNAFARTVLLETGTKISSSSKVNSDGTPVSGGELTVEDAVKKAIQNSSSLRTIDENKSLSQTEFDNTSTSITYYSSDDDTSDYMDLAVQYKKLAIALNNYDANTEVTKQQIEQSIRQYFVSIIEAQQAIDLYEQDMELQKQEIEIDEVKLNLGLISRSDYNSAVNEYNTLKTKMETLQSNLEDAYLNLNVLMGGSNTVYDIVYDYEYEDVIDTLSLTSIISKAQSGSYSITQKKNTLEVAKYDYEKYAYSISSSYSSDTRDSKHATYNQASRDYNDALDQIETTLTSLYNQLKESEQTHSDNVSTLALKKEQLEISAKKLELGQITELEYAQAEYEITELENTIRNSEYEHDLLVRELKNPDLVL